MVNLCKSKVSVSAAQNILWDDPKFQPNWVPSLPPKELSAAAGKRVGSVIAKYKGQVIHWDVVNENLHFNFFESKLGANASATFYRLASQFDNKTPLFLNDFNTIEDQRDGASSPANYLNKIKQLRAGGYNGVLGIGLEGHFVTRVGLISGRTRYTCFCKIAHVDHWAKFLDEIIKEVVGHPAVQGLLIWSAWSPQGCYRMCLTDNNFKNLPTGDVCQTKFVRHYHTRWFVGTTNAEVISDYCSMEITNVVTRPSLPDWSFHYNLMIPYYI
ncbi:hypothetical protein HAX54_009765 [Datura stramonium]|uniref:GH10 domain-containing protein n=1 Tax=Datura stramonium TaxID=4076 RepID=A0ABS8RWE9_DATST|nr:hypothetical protein [Datura stramonium]